MPHKKIIEKLCSLVQLDIDAVKAYDQAIKNIDHDFIRERLSDFQDDHDRHIRQLSQEIRQLKGEAPEYKRDIKGFLIEGFTAIRSLTGTEGALKAMRGNEILTNKKYAEALSTRMSESIRKIVQRNYEDEQRHLRFIDQTITRRSWEMEVHL